MTLLGVVKHLVQVTAVHGLAARWAAIIVMGGLWAGLGTPWKVRLVDVFEFARHAAIIRRLAPDGLIIYFRATPRSATAVGPV